MVQYESLLRTEMSLLDFAIVNDALDVQNENDRRLYEHEERKHRSGRR